MERDGPLRPALTGGGVHAFFRRPGLHNLAALTVIQGSNALVPLVVVPFVLVMVGADAYAPVAIAEAVSVLVLAAVLYSFDLEGVARIVQLGPAPDRAALGAVLSDVMAARMSVFALLAPLSLAIFHLVYGEGTLLLALWLLVPLGHVFHSYFLYQALERNIPAAAITLLARVVTLVIVFGFVRGPQNAYLLPLAVGLPFVVGGLVSLAYILAVLGIPLRAPSPARVSEALWKGKEIFAGNLSVALYRDSNVMILAAIGVPATAISAYSLAEKLVKVAQAVSRPLSQLYLPKVLRVLADAQAPDRVAAKQVARFTVPQLAANTGLIIFFAAALLIAAPFADRVGAIRDVSSGALLAAIMAPAMLFGVANYMFGSAGLNALHQQRYFFTVIVATGLISVFLCTALASLFGATGAAIAFVSAEAILCALVLLRYRHATFGRGGAAHE